MSLITVTHDSVVSLTLNLSSELIKLVVQNKALLTEATMQSLWAFVLSFPQMALKLGSPLSWYELLRSMFTDAGYYPLFQRAVQATFGSAAAAGLLGKNITPCAQCGETASSYCGACVPTLYCGAKCQKEHYSIHKDVCKE